MTYIERFFLVLADIPWQHTEFLLETFGKVRGGGETDLIGYFADGEVGSEQQPIASVQAGRAQQFYG